MCMLLGRPMVWTTRKLLYRKTSRVDSGKWFSFGVVEESCDGFSPRKGDSRTTPIVGFTDINPPREGLYRINPKTICEMSNSCVLPPLTIYCLDGQNTQIPWDSTVVPGNATSHPPSWDIRDIVNPSWWRQQMETFSALLALSEVNPPVTAGFPPQRPVTRRFDVFFDLRLNKQSICWWFETTWRSSCPHCNDGVTLTHQRCSPAND